MRTSMNQEVGVLRRRYLRRHKLHSRVCAQPALLDLLRVT